jgi:hypothetical protein
VHAILSAQAPDGAIVWFEDGPWDAWNHAECVMALGAAGEIDAARRGFDYLAQSQEPGGGWLCGYGNALPMEGRLKLARVAAPQVRDTNFAAYPAVALWHRRRLDGDLALARRYWPMVRAAMDFVLARQHPQGDISWSAEGFGGASDDAVRAGCASIYASLGCALALAAELGDVRPGWAAARARLGQALRERPERFDRAGADRSAFAMDWYYPVLAGVLSGDEAAARIAAGEARFVRGGRGCRCVATQPWATVAESAELALALISLGRAADAAEILAWQEAHRDGDGAYWMGWQFEEDIAWPQEKPTWTQAAMILAHDALNGGVATRHALAGAP